MTLSRKLYKLAKTLRTRHENMHVVAEMMGTNVRTLSNWKTSKKITVTPSLIKGLNSFGYDIDIVKIKEGARD